MAIWYVFFKVIISVELANLQCLSSHCLTHSSNLQIRCVVTIVSSVHYELKCMALVHYAAVICLQCVMLHSPMSAVQYYVALSSQGVVHCVTLLSSVQYICCIQFTRCSALCYTYAISAVYVAFISPDVVHCVRPPSAGQLFAFISAGVVHCVTLKSAVQFIALRSNS